MLSGSGADNSASFWRLIRSGAPPASAEPSVMCHGASEKVPAQAGVPVTSNSAPASARQSADSRIQAPRAGCSALEQDARERIRAGSQITQFCPQISGTIAHNQQIFGPRHGYIEHAQLLRAVFASNPVCNGAARERGKSDQMCLAPWPLRRFPASDGAKQGCADPPR